MSLKYAQPSPVVTYAKSETLPSTVLDGSKTNIGAAAAALSTDGEITRGVLIRVDSLGGGTYIKIGNSTSQNLILSSVDTFLFIDWSDSLSKIYVKSDGTNAAISWNGG